MRVAKWGNSLAIRLPRAVVEVLALHEGDDITIRVEGERSFAVRRQPSPDDMLARLRKYRGTLPADFRFDRNTAHER